jgi:hypothetical protein
LSFLVVSLSIQAIIIFRRVEKHAVGKSPSHKESPTTYLTGRHDCGVCHPTFGNTKNSKTAQDAAKSFALFLPSPYTYARKTSILEMLHRRFTYN